MSTLKPGARVRATIEATIAVADSCGVILRTPQRLVTLTGDNWSFEVLEKEPEWGDVIPRDGVNNYTWQDGAVLRTSKPNAPVHRAGGQWWFGARGVFISDFPAGTEFQVLAVGV